MRSEHQVLRAFHDWGDANDNIRAIGMTGSRANKDHPPDVLSDYDIEVFVHDTRPFAADGRWVEYFGAPMVRWPLTPRPTLGPEWITQLVLFEDGVRIDFQVTTVATLDLRPAGDEAASADRYRVLLDKDDLAPRLVRNGPPADEIALPTAAEFADRVNAFWWDIVYVAKALCRGETHFAKYMLDCTIRFEKLLPLLEWYIGVRAGTRNGAGIYGRRLHRFLPRQLWVRYLGTFVGPGVAENWSAMYRMVDIVEEVAPAVADGLAYRYPHSTARNVTGYIRSVEQGCD